VPPKKNASYCLNSNLIVKSLFIKTSLSFLKVICCIIDFMLHNSECKNIIIAALLATGVGILSSCQKNIVDQPVAAPTPVTNNGPSAEYKLKDSVVQLTRDIYLWYNQIPSTFDPHSLATPVEAMTAIRAYSIESPFTTPVDKWSFAMKKTEWDNSSSGHVQQTAEGSADLGLTVFFRTEGDLRVANVEPESAAGKAAVHRGWRITKLNGSTNITTGNATQIISGVYESASSTFTFQKPDGTTVNVTLNANAYNEHPIVVDSVYAAGSKKVGYLVFNSFLGDTTQIYNDFSRVFSRFSREGVNEVIIDLRYNGGGYVTVQERLANYLVNAAYNGQVMMTEKFNDKNSGYNSTTRFKKLGSLNLNRIFFIASSSTASASELLINNLKAYMDVRLVGPSNTTGKPVGFFPIPVGEWYIFPVSFRTVNKNGEGSYFNGLAPTNRASDGVDKDWGDRSEAALSSILNGFSSGAFRTIDSEHVVADPAIQAVNNTLSQREFKGTIDTRGLH
jgi:carboxyl-terminal processing protease